GAPVVAADAIKKDSDKAAFVTAEFRRARRRIDASGVRALVEAVGTDLRELAAACSQLVTDTDGTASEAVVDRYYCGRGESEEFRAELRVLAAACRQLVTDTDGTVSEAVVDRYYGGRVEATGFRVADAAVAGHAGEAVALLRHALATGADPVPIVAALAMKLR